MTMIKKVFFVLVVSVLCSVQSLPDEIKEIMDNLHKTCIAESGATDELVNQANTPNFPDDASFKCYCKCIMTETGTLDESGIVDTEMVIQMMPPEMLSQEIKDTVNSCGTQKGSHLCDTAWRTQKCWHDKLLDAIPDDVKEAMEQLHNTCRDEVQVSEELIQETAKGNFVDDEKLKCYFKCIMVNTAIMNEDGIVDVEAAVAMLPEEYQGNGIPETIRKCSTQTGKDHCDTAFKTNKCYYDNNPKHFFTI